MSREAYDEDTQEVVTPQLALDASLMAVAPSECDDLLLTLSSIPSSVSIAISAIPIGPGALAVRLEPPVLPVCLNYDEALFGPLYAPGELVCPECLDYWLHMNFYDHDDRPRRPHDALLRLLPEHIEEWFTAAVTPRGSARSVRISDGSAAHHPIVPRRDCRRCGDRPRVEQPLRTHCSRWTGIVNRLDRTTGPSAGAYRATATWASPLPVANARRHLKRQDSYGRGRTPSEAEAGCIAEALERYSLIYRGDEHFVRGTLSEVDAIHPDDIQLFSAAQYRERSNWNVSAEDDVHVPEPFQPEVPVDWIEARPLGRSRNVRFVPAAICLMWYAFRPGEPEFALADTIGCASGVTFDDALTRALLEWVERDAMAIWWDNMLRRPGLRLESFESPDLNVVVEGLQAIGRELFLLDCTTDIGIPAYMAVAPRLDGSEPLVAGAADPSPRRAAYRAASEVGQVWYEAKRSGGLPSSLSSWLLQETTSTQPHLTPATLIEAPSESTAYDRPAWTDIVERLEAVGLRAYAVDHSRTDVIVRTVRAVVPGLRHIWNRRAPGRLYDLPVKMGWLTSPTREEYLNPICCML